MFLLSDLFLPAFQAAGYALLRLIVRLRAAWRSLSAVCAAVAAHLAAALPPLRPLLAAVFALPPKEHIGSRPQAPNVIGVAIAEQLADRDLPAAAEALGTLLSWAHSQGFSQILIYEPSGTLKQAATWRQLELQLLQRRLTGAVRLQAGWQGPGADPTALPHGSLLTAVVLAADDGQWPLLAAAAAGQCGSSPASNRDPGSKAADAAATSASSAIDEAIRAPSKLRRRVQQAAGPLAGAEPDFVLVTGPALTLAGFPAWAVRTSEIYGIGRLAELSSDRLEAALQRFKTTKQRFGK